MGKHLLKGTLVLIVVTLIAGCASGPIGKLPAIADWSGSGKRADFYRAGVEWSYLSPSPHPVESCYT